MQITGFLLVVVGVFLVYLVVTNKATTFFSLVTTGLHNAK